MGEVDLRRGLCMGNDFILVTSFVTGFNYFRAQIKLLAFSSKFLPILTKNKSVIVISTKCNNFKMHYLESVTCCRIFMVHLLLIFMNI